MFQAAQPPDGLLHLLFWLSRQTELGVVSFVCPELGRSRSLFLMFLLGSDRACLRRCAHSQPGPTAGGLYIHIFVGGQWLSKLLQHCAVMVLQETSSVWWLAVPVQITYTVNDENWQLTCLVLTRV